MHFICHYGTLDNVYMEYTEHAHIPFAKVPYQCSNKHDPLPQMIKQVVCQGAIEQKMAILGLKSNAMSTQSQTENFMRQTLSSKTKEGPLSLKYIKTLFKLPGLGVALRTYFHDFSYEEIDPGKGKSHRVSKRRLLTLDDFFFFLTRPYINLFKLIKNLHQISAVHMG